MFRFHPRLGATLDIVIFFTWKDKVPAQTSNPQSRVEQKSAMNIAITETSSDAIKTVSQVGILRNLILGATSAFMLHLEIAMDVNSRREFAVFFYLRPVPFGLAVHWSVSLPLSPEPPSVTNRVSTRLGSE